ncbi:hypothetical protein [Parvibaculum sp.]|uniref:hypothetical protein n=1 Tax=Parvibaculum sp. TaxID=2024848 RepID=UPI002C86AA28|nr:hypothetical protein [Parvibaculum sp.]HUD50607.1 hypothetical protein [Parvibaculum sp.]
MALSAAGFALVLMGSAALAEDPAAPSEATQPNGDKVYELKDEPDSPPVNYRSNEDPRYATPDQHDAEMYAEQYEQKRREEQVKQQKLLDSVNKVAPGDQRGTTDDGFPSRSRY